MNGMSIPETDGIVGGTGMESLANLGKIASLGMAAMDGQILQIMQAKLRHGED
jgi:L-cysteine desulfidase